MAGKDEFAAALEVEVQRERYPRETVIDKVRPHMSPQAFRSLQKAILTRGVSPTGIWRALSSLGIKDEKGNALSISQSGIQNLCREEREKVEAGQKPHRSLQPVRPSRAPTKKAAPATAPVKKAPVKKAGTRGRKQ